MKKSELSELRTLYLTKTMKDALHIESDKYTPYGRKCKWKYMVAARCQQLGRILKISICTREDVFNNIIKPKYDIFIDYEDYAYVTRELQDDGTYKWRNAMIDNLPFNDPWYDRTTEKICYINPEGSRSIRQILKTKESGFEGIVEWQRACKKRKSDQLYEKNKKQWANELSGIKELPNSFEKWWHKEGFRQNYVFYRPEKDKVVGICTYCQNKVDITNIYERKKRKTHNYRGFCPNCHKPVDFISRNIKKQPIWSHFETVSIMQRFKEGLIHREFNVRRTDKSDKLSINTSEYEIYEFRRTVLNANETKVYIYDNYKLRGMCWMKDPEQRINKYKENIYPGNLKALLRNMHTSYLIAAENGYRAAGIVYFLTQENKNPIIEQLYKAGLYNIATKFVNYPYLASDIEIDYTAKDLSKKLCIDNARMKRLKEMEGDEITLYWLQREKKENTQYKDSDIKILSMLDIDSNTYKRCKVFKYLSISKICNYIERQLSIRGGAKGVNIKSIWRDWNDYIDMMDKAKMDLTKEILLKPKDLLLAHNELVARLSMKNNKAEIEERKKKYSDAEALMNSGELKKYEYEDDTYMIISPESIDDIYREGTILKHCIHTCEIYFGRFNIRETYLMFLRRKSEPETPWYTLEIEPGGNIRQKKSVLNEAYDDLDAAIPFLEKWQKWVKANLSKKDKELAEKSNQARIEGYKKLREDKKIIWHGRLQGTLLVDALEDDFMPAV